MSTTLAAILIALVGVIGVLAVSWTFYVVGRAEDRDRREAAPRGEPEPPPDPEPGPPPHEAGPAHPRPGEVARQRARRRPPRRPG